MMETTDRRNPNRFKSKRVAFFAIYISVVIFVGLINWGILSPSPQQELLGTTSIQSWVPVYIVHNPPGETSRIECYTNYTPISLRLESISAHFSVDCKIDTRMDGSGFETGVGYNGSIVSALFLNQTWNLWRYSDGSNTWLQAELVDHSYRGGGLFREDNAAYINSRSIMIWNQTPSQSAYALKCEVANDTTEEVTTEWTQNSFFPLGLGYMIHIFGYDVHLNVSLSVDTPITNIYVLGNNMSALTTWMYCNGPITEIGTNHYQVAGALIWLSE